MASKIFILGKDYQEIIKTEIRDEIADLAVLNQAEQASIEQMISYLNSKFDISNLFPAIQPWSSRLLYTPGDYVDHNGTFVRALNPTNTNSAVNRNQVPTGATLSTDGEPGDGVYWSNYTFPNIKDYDAAEAITAGMYRVDNETIYLAKVNTAAGGTLPSADIDENVWKASDPRSKLLVEHCCKLSLYKAHARISPDAVPQIRKEDHDMSIEWLKAAAAGKVAPLLPKLAETDQNKETVRFGGLIRKDYTF